MASALLVEVVLRGMNTFWRRSETLVGDVEVSRDR